MNSKLVFVLVLILSGRGVFISSAQADVISSANNQAELVSNRTMNAIQNNLENGRWVLKCRSELFGAMPQETPVKMTYDQAQQLLSLGISNTNDIHSLSFSSKNINNQITKLVHSQSGFTAQNNNCSENSKMRTDFSYIEKDGSGVIGSFSPIAVLRVENLRRDLSLSSECTAGDIASCSCSDSDYLLRDKFNLECGIYTNPYKLVNDTYASTSLAEIFTEISKYDSAAKESISSGYDNYEKLQDSLILKYRLSNLSSGLLTPSLLWNSLPYFTQESYLNSVSSILVSEEVPDESMISAALLSNLDRNDQAVKNMIETIKENANLKFYHFMANSSIAEHSVHGWIVVDSKTGELLVARRTKHAMLERELIFKKQQTVPFSGLMPGANGRGDYSQSPIQSRACSGSDIYFKKQNLPARGDLSKCFIKNNPKMNGNGYAGLIPWKQVLNDFLKGSELSAESSFEAPGVCYDRDGIPARVELGEVKRAPQYIIKNGSQVAFYSHQVLQRTGHDIWPIGQEACEGKEEIYKEGVLSAFSWAKEGDFRTEALSLAGHPNQCFTQYQAAFHYSTQGITRFFMRKTTYGIVVVWPRPRRILDRLDDVPLVCIFPSQAIKTSKSNLKK